MRIFVAGLSKSGKTTRSVYVAERLPALQYISVSQLLRSSSAILPVATLVDGLVNQEIAAAVLLAQPRTHAHQIIDGHALIETMAGPLLVPDAFFESVSPDLLIHVRDNPHKILQRRQPNTSSVGEIEALAALEQAACERIAARLRIPLLTADSSSLAKFCAEIEHRLTKPQ